MRVKIPKHEKDSIIKASKLKAPSSLSNNKK
jgi:hypothetical protein